MKYGFVEDRSIETSVNRELGSVDLIAELELHAHGTHLDLRHVAVGVGVDRLVQPIDSVSLESYGGISTQPLIKAADTGTPLPTSS